MESLQVNLIALLGMLEVIVVLLVVAVVLTLRGRHLARRVRLLQKRLGEVAEAPEPVSFEQYLRDEVLRNQGLVDRARASDDDAEKKAAELLELRKRFLELELAAQAKQANPVQFQDTLAAGISELIDAMRPTPQIQSEAGSEPVDIVAASAPGQEKVQRSEPRSTRDTRDEELVHLKQVINNQQDAMAELRAKLESLRGEPADLEAVLQKLAVFERESAELQRCLEVLERENERLKQAKSEGQLAGTKAAPASDLKLGGLKSMVDKQQQTIGNLQNLIRELAPEAGKARELEEAITHIQRTNDELNGCVAVLEDENVLLRAELDEVNAYIARQEALQAAAANAEPQAAAAALAESPREAEDAVDLDAFTCEDAGADEQQRELEIKVQELEALLEFKDAAIEELEKQYNALEARYLAATGQKKVD